MTSTFFPFLRNIFLIAAYNNEGFSSKGFPITSSLIAAAPAISSSISIPATAIGSRPTAVSTENLPPISSGTTKLSYPSSLASDLSAPLALSVVA